MRAAALAMLALALPPLVAAKPARAEPVTLVTPLAYGTHLPGLGEPAASLAKLIKERSGGTLLLDLKQPGEGTKPHEILDKVSDRQGRCGLRHRELLGGQAPRRFAVRGLPVRPRWRDLSRLVRAGQRQQALSGDVRPCRAEGACHAVRFRRRRSRRLVRQGDQDQGRPQGPAHAHFRARRQGHGAAGATTVLLPGGELVAAFDKRRSMPPNSIRRPPTAAGPQGQGQAHLYAGLAPARDRA